MKYIFYLCSSYCACMRAQVLSRVLLFETPWTIAYQAPLSMVFPRQEYWSGLPFASPGDLPNLTQRWNLCLLCLPAKSGRLFTIAPPGKPKRYIPGLESVGFINGCVFRYSR